jgi:DNA mismatch repair protein MutL
MAERKIKILPESLSNQIAAGEVIDRPSSVLKELIENAIDAGATEIVIRVADGGKSLIQVVDNGCGMVEEDAILAFERHSTSKISEPKDLARIATMGFRGEALASIASVSRVEIKTRVADEDTATHLVLEGGVIRQHGRTAANPGTSIAVKSLFFNTPARRKFLKSDLAEYRHLLQVAYRYFLSFPDISFRFYKNEQVIYNLPAATLRERIGQIFGEKYAENVLEVNLQTNRGNVTGLVGNMDLFRQSRGEQFLFLNRRYIVNKSLNWAIISAYGSMLPQGAYPFYVINLELDPEKVDVNVHPSKIEVRFEDERGVYVLVHHAVKSALTHAGVAPVLHLEVPSDAAEKEIPLLGEEVGKESANTQTSLLETEKKKTVFPEQTELAFPFEFRHQRRQVDIPEEPKRREKGERADGPQYFEREKGEQVSVWQLHNKYLLSQIKSGLIVVDQHLAHERILYEQALQRLESSRPISQQKLFPKTVELAPEDFELLIEMQFYLSRLGFVVREFGKNTVLIEAVPVELKNREEEQVLREMIDDFRESKEPDIRERIAKTYACKSAIKAGDPLSQEEMIALIDNLFATRNPYFCPHGRPIIVTIPLEELDKRFLRI